MIKKTLAAGLVSAIALIGCSHESSSDAKAPDSGNLQVSLNYTSTNHLDSLVLTGIGTDTIHYRLGASDKALELELYPSVWTFDAKLYAGGILMQHGEGETEIKSGEHSYLQIALKALYGFIDVEIPLGLGNPSGIAGGTLTLKSDDSTYTYNIKIREPFAYFESDALPLDRWYEVSLDLFDAKGGIVYNSTDSLYLDPENASVNWSLTSLKGTLSVSIVADEISKVQVDVGFASRDRRTPRQGDAIFSEFLAIPKSGTPYEFIEFYNATLDTLLLDNCEIKLKASSSGATTIPEGTVLLPASYITIGADSTEAIHPESWFSSGITNTRASLSLVCDGIVVDSIAYSISAEQESDSIKIESSTSTHLDLSYWEIHNSGKAWCNGEATPNFASPCYVEEDNSGENIDF